MAKPLGANGLCRMVNALRINADFDSCPKRLRRGRVMSRLEKRRGSHPFLVEAPPLVIHWNRECPDSTVSMLCLPVVGMTGIDELLTRAVSRIKPHLEGHGRIARALLKLENGFIGCFKASVWNGYGRRQDLGFIRIPDLDDVPVRRAISQSENVGPRRQNLPG